MPTISLPFFFFHDTATTELSTLSLHDALPIWRRADLGRQRRHVGPLERGGRHARAARARPVHAVHRRAHQDRKSTRLNSSHVEISYAVFCLKKKSTYRANRG